MLPNAVTRFNSNNVIGKLQSNKCHRPVVSNRALLRPSNDLQSRKGLNRPNLNSDQRRRRAVINHVSLRRQNGLHRRNDPNKPGLNVLRRSQLLSELCLQLAAKCRKSSPSARYQPFENNQRKFRALSSQA
jgi:hypothetical protein